MASTSPLSSSGSEQADPFIRRIEVWRREVAAANALDPTPFMEEPQSILQRFHGRLVKKMQDVKEKMGVVNDKMPKDEDRGNTKMYVPAEKENEMERRNQATVWRTGEFSGRVGDNDQIKGSTKCGESSSELRGEERRVDERQARLERAAQLLMRQRQIELEELEAMGEAEVLV